MSGMPHTHLGIDDYREKAIHARSMRGAGVREYRRYLPTLGGALCIEERVGRGFVGFVGILISAGSVNGHPRTRGRHGSEISILPS